MINKYEGNGDSENVACVTAENALFPVYRKELRKVLFNRESTVDACNEKRPHIIKVIMETQKELKDSEGFDWLESTELAISK